ncbi:MAG: DUF3199 family protein [Oscillospiraceae bacterium]|nr:DUF3199 family protein [Oscillospiraceae bacterium]MCD8365554.1 DUF3199 family protein [Clostridiales bacterium]
MADRPWVTPDEVKAYSEYTVVQNRSDERLTVDISRAEQWVIAYTHNDFSLYDTIPEAVKTAVLLLAEMYAYNSSAAVGADGKSTGGRRLKSESFDDYSYTASDNDDGITLDDLDVKLLLEPYILAVPQGNVIMRMRRL